MPISPVTRRAALARLMTGATLAASAPILSGRVWAATAPTVRLGDAALTIEFDAAMRSRLFRNDREIAPWTAAEALFPVAGAAFDRFVLLDHVESPIPGGRRHVLRGTAGGTVEQEIAVTFLDRFPGLALYDVRFRNTGQAPLAVAGWRVAMHDLHDHPDGAWSFAGASYPDRRDWIQKVGPGFEQRNFMGMNGSDYGGGTPVAVVWRRDAGLAVGHLETVPRLVALPVSAQPGGTRIGMTGDAPQMLAPGATLALPSAFVMAHEGDHFRPLDAYRQLMAERGLKAPAIPEASYGPIWCAWGYERKFTPEQIYGALPKARNLGFEWAVIDDGWQIADGDWRVDRSRFPRGDADMKGFADRIKADGMRPRLWLAPLAADPDTPLLRDHPDMLLLDRDGAAQNVTWWNAFTLCPAYQPTVDYFRTVVRKIVGEWGFEGLKLDGQHLNGVAPCYNPAHNHARPEESFEKLQDFWKAIYDEALAINPQAVIELCPCGDSFAFHNIPAMNNTPASDPTSSWQVRLKGKTFKALMGPSAPFSGDHVELTETRDDFASTYGIGAIPSTKFTWPEDTTTPSEPLPPGGYKLTAEKEKLWRKWIDLYRADMLAKGTYLGGLYDIGFDKPEGHAIEKDGALHYAFFAETWDGQVSLRGLGAGRYALTDGFTGAALGNGTASRNTISAKFERFLLVRAVPSKGAQA